MSKMNDLIKFLYDINRVTDMSLENKKDYFSNSSLYEFERKIINLSNLHGYRMAEAKINCQKYYDHFIEVVYEAMLNASEYLEANAFESKIKGNFSFEDEIEDFVLQFETDNVNKKNIVKLTKKLENESRSFVLEKYKNAMQESIDIIYKSGFSFLEEKIFNNANEIELPNGNKIKKIRFDEEYKMLKIHDGNDWQESPRNHTEYILLARECMRAIIENELKQSNTFSKLIINKMEVTDYRIEDSFLLAQSINKNKQLLKNKKVDIIEMFNCPKKVNEDIQDVIDKVEENHNVEKFAYSILSKKYKKLIEGDEEENQEYTTIKSSTFDLFKGILDAKVSEEKLQEYIGKKLAGFHNNQALEEALGRLLNSYTDFNMEAKKEQIENINAEVISDENEMLIVKVNDFEASKAIGSSSWCISRHDSYWDTYANRSGNEQYFMYDFKKASQNKDSMIGITIDTVSKEVYAAHYKNDEDASNNVEDLFNYIMKKEKKKMKPSI